MKARALLTIPVSALLGSLLLADCSKLEIHCDTAKNCLEGQVCTKGLCEAPTDGGNGGSGGSGGATTSSSKSSSSSTTSGTTTGTTSSATSTGSTSSTAATTSSTSTGGSSGCASGCPSGQYCDSADMCAACNVDAHCGSSCGACSGGKPFCVNSACVQCKQKSDCSGLTPCCVNGTCQLGAC